MKNKKNKTLTRFFWKIRVFELKTLQQALFAVFHSASDFERFFSENSRVFSTYAKNRQVLQTAHILKTHYCDAYFFWKDQLLKKLFTTCQVLFEKVSKCENWCTEFPFRQIMIQVFQRVMLQIFFLLNNESSMNPPRILFASLSPIKPRANTA